MSRVALSISVMAILIGGVAMKLAIDARLVAEDAVSQASRAGKDLKAVRERLEETRGEAEAAASARRAAEERTASLETRLAALASASPTAAASAPGSSGAAGAEPAGGALVPAKPPAADPALAAEFRDLRKKVFRNEASPDEQKRFWELAKSPGLMDGVLADMEAAVAGSPEDLPARMELGQSYIAKLFTVPPGPEMGTWAAKAEGQWKEVLARDDRHWDARMALATSFARYPEFLNKTADAIREFETLRKQQEGGPAEAKQSRVYLELGNLYKRAGNPTKQRETFEEGHRRHPEEEDLRKALEVLDAR